MKILSNFKHHYFLFTDVSENCKKQYCQNDNLKKLCKKTCASPWLWIDGRYEAGDVDKKEVSDCKKGFHSPASAFLIFIYNSTAIKISHIVRILYLREKLYVKTLFIYLFLFCDYFSCFCNNIKWFDKPLLFFISLICHLFFAFASAKLS